ncbi:MAG TPA: ABC transporter substrate-binding protein [Caproiciproducens sp.]|nr:ABC transporter substrate-binding protein [Caproiciproducens sp.]
MKSVRKSVSLVLALCLMASTALAGCGNTAPASAAPAAASAAPAASTAEASSAEASSAPKETVTLKLMTGDKKIQGLDRVQEAVNAYLKEKNTGLQIAWETYTWDELKQKTATMLQTGQEVDIINTSSWLTPGYVAHCQKNELTDITKYINDSQYKEVVDIIGKDFLDGTKVNGKYYGMPTNKEKAHNFGFLCQTSELKKLNIDPKSIKTMEDLEKYFDKVKADGLIPVCAAQMDSPYKFLDWDAFDADISPFAFDPKDETKIVNPFTADKTIAFYKKMKTWHDKGYFSPDVLTSKGQESDMASGKYFCGSWSLMPGKAISESTSLKLDLTQIDITPVEKTNRETLGALLAIPASSKHPDEAFKFISMLYTDKTLINLMTYGVEGKDYTKKSDNVITVSKDTDFSSAGGWIMGNQFNNYLTDAQPETLFKDIEAYNGSAKVLDDLGFVYDSSKCKTEYGACQAVVNKYYPQLFFGTSDVDATMVKFNSELKAAGIDKLLSDVQSQYDNWNKSK